MFYIIYKITNQLDGKIYIGKHQTKDLNDGYMGSGKMLKRAIEKYGLENFSKEILFQFDNEFDMNIKEAELVTKEFVKENTNYNLCPGGNGGFGYINSNTEILLNRDPLPGRIAANKVILEKYGTLNFLKEKRKCKKYDAEYRKKVSDGLKKYFEANPGTFTGNNHTEETKQKMRKSKNQGSKNPQFNKMWIYSLIEKKSIMIDKDDDIPNGWLKGRKIKF